MKVRLTEEMDLIVEAESPVEALALRYWISNYNPESPEGCESKLAVSAFVQAKEAFDG